MPEYNNFCAAFSVVSENGASIGDRLGEVAIGWLAALFSNMPQLHHRLQHVQMESTAPTACLRFQATRAIRRSSSSSCKSADPVMPPSSRLETFIATQYFTKEAAF